MLFLSLGRKPREAQMACPIRDNDFFEDMFAHLWSRRWDATMSEKLRQ